MHETYVFDFLKTISLQLKDTLESITESPLNPITLQALLAYQEENGAKQGVYVIHHNNVPVYVGKADNVYDRLCQHLAKLSGRRNILSNSIGYKALLLDKTMSTAANEKVLIALFKEDCAVAWNGAGFGPKDPGQNRDTTEPGWFDLNFPIIEDFPITVSMPENSQIAVGALLGQMKAQLPFVFRYSVPELELASLVNLSGVPADARSLLQAVVSHLGQGWKGAIISYGMVLYKTKKEYSYGVEILPICNHIPL